MWPDWVSNPGSLTYESGVLPIALRGPADSQEKSHFPYVCSSASLTSNIYVYLLSIFISNKKNNKWLHTTSKPKQKSSLGTVSNKITGGVGRGCGERLQLVCGRPISPCSPLVLLWVPQTLAWRIPSS